MRNRFLMTMAVFAMMTFWAGIVSAQTTYTNPATITIPDSGPATPYPSNIVVAGSTGNISDVNVRINGLTHTWPDDLDFLLVAPNGAKMIIQADVGGSTAVTNRTYTIDDQAATQLPDNSLPAEGTSARPANYPGGDTFPPPAPGGPYSNPAPAGTATLNGTFGGASANGTWSLYLMDAFAGDSGSISGGWSLIITTGGGPAAIQNVIDYNGDGRTDFSVVRAPNQTSQMVWWNKLNVAAGNGAESATPWGVGFGFFTYSGAFGDAAVPEDYDGDNKSDIAVWRPGAPGTAAFYILQSLTNTFRGEFFGQTGDNPTVVGDYDGDGKTDLAVYRRGATAGAQSFFYYRGSLSNPSGGVTFIPWGVREDFATPGYYDGDLRMDVSVYRPSTVQGTFITRNSSTGTATFTGFGAGTTLILNDRIGVPNGDFDGDGRTDYALIRSNGTNYIWYILNSSTGTISYITWGRTSVDEVIVGDYDGDGKSDPAVYRTGQAPDNTHFIWLRSSDGAQGQMEWGATPGPFNIPDLPVGINYIH